MNGLQYTVSSAFVQHLHKRHSLTLLSYLREVFVALETEHLCMFVFLVIGRSGEHRTNYK